VSSSRRIQKSKLLSYVLRHAPQSFGLALDHGGWVSIDELLNALEAQGHPLSRDELLDIVADDSKQRFGLTDGATRIRANQGHSTAVKLDYEPATPPETLYHGTVERFWSSIARDGLLRRARHHVHLSESLEVARQVGARRGAPLLLAVASREMSLAGHVFFRAANGVWLTDHVPVRFLRRDPPIV
jgi:putative RNA 2'-phosphotransferase